jgi:alpha-beta hydrolase superfamily lysophospholipase
MCLAVLLSTVAAFAAEVPYEHSAPPLRCWTPTLPPRFALFCIHGLGLNSNSYADFAKRVNRFGGIVYAIDVRGFGAWKEEGQHDKIDFDATLADVKVALKQIHTAHPMLPVFMLGESMGGAIALRATSMYQDQITGLVSCVPAAERFQTKRTDLKVALELLRGPNHEFDIGKQIVKQAATAGYANDGKDVKVINKKLETSWEDDPMNRMKLSPKELMQFQAFMNDNHDAVKKITDVPVLFVEGLDDRLVKPEGTFALAQEVGTQYRMFVAFPTRHLVFEETQSSDPRVNRASTQVVMAWINTHILADEPNVH